MTTNLEMDLLQKSLARITAQRQAANRAAILTSLLGLLLLGGLGFYFYLGYRAANYVTQPKNLVAYVGSLAEDRLPEARTSIEQEVSKNAPVWSQGLSKQILENLPRGRQTLEDQLLNQLDTAVAEASKITDDEFSKFLKNNKSLIEAKFKELSTSDRLADQSLKEIQEALDREFQADLKERARELSQTLHTLNERLVRLKQGTRLTPEETLERRSLLLARRLQVEGQDPSLSGKKIGTEEPDIKLEKPQKPSDPKDAGKKPEEKRPEPVKENAKKPEDKKEPEKK